MVSAASGRVACRIRKAVGASPPRRQQITKTARVGREGRGGLGLRAAERGRPEAQLDAVHHRPNAETGCLLRCRKGLAPL